MNGDIDFKGFPLKLLGDAKDGNLEKLKSVVVIWCQVFPAENPGACASQEEQAPHQPEKYLSIFVYG
jgi:hypothetical protein